MANDRLTSIVALEFIGMFYVLLCIHTGSESPLFPFAVFSGFFLAIFITAKVSGGQVNAAVSYLCYLNDKDKDPEAGNKYLYCAIAQIAGGFVAGCIAKSCGFPLANLDDFPKGTFLLAAIFMEGRGKSSSFRKQIYSFFS